MTLPRTRLAFAVLVAACALAGAVRAQVAGSMGGGAVRGIVVDADFEVALPEVVVTVLGSKQSTRTTAAGTFLIEGLSAGRHALSFAKPGFRRRIAADVAVVPGGLADLRVVLEAEFVEMDEFVVATSDPAGGSELVALELRAASVNLQDSLSAEILGKAGVSDAAGALRLVVGASVAEGKYATVRGLSDRYTGTTLNGLRLPSADPRRRAVQLDLFPTATIQGIDVTKTFTPDLQGDFTGGGVDIKTKSAPDGFLLSLSASVEHDGLATGQGRFLSYRGGGVPVSGMAGNERELPAVARVPSLSIPAFSASPTPEQLAASRQYDDVTRAFAPAMGVRRSAPGFNRSASAAIGNSWLLPRDMKLGAIAALTWQRKSSTVLGGRNDSGAVSGSDTPIAILSPRRDDKSTHEVLLGALATVNFRTARRHDFILRFVGNQAAEDEARLQVEQPDEIVVEQNQSLHYTERSLRTLELTATHRPWKPADDSKGAWRGLQLKWSAARSRTRQWEPDVRFFRNSHNTQTFASRRPSNSTDAQNTRRIFRDLVESSDQGRLDLEFPFLLGERGEGRLKAGAFVESSVRSFEQDSFTYVFPSQFGPASNPNVARNRSVASWVGTSADELWTDVFTDEDRIGMAGNGAPAPNQLLWSLVPLGSDVDYDGDQRVEAAYVMGEIPLLRRLRLTAGARKERTSISVAPLNQAFGRVEAIELLPGGARGVVQVAQETAGTGIDSDDLLPAVSVAWEIVPKLTLRASWTRTLARPTFRELAPVITEEFIFGDEFLGNPSLRLSSIENWDLRGEWFHSDGGVVALSLFEKELEDPIEYLSFAAGGRSFVQPVNFGAGSVRGIEFEARSSLGVFGWERLETLVIGVNGTLLEAEVEVPDGERESLEAFGLDEPTRRLQGQPEHLLNVQVTWDDDDRGLSAGAFYTLTGDTLLTGAARGVEDGKPNVFERGRASLDLTFEKVFGSGFSLSVKARNVLREPAETYYAKPDGEEAVKTRAETAMRVSVGTSFKW